MAFLRTVQPSGEFITLAKDLFVGQSLRQYGEWSHAEITMMKMFVHPQANVVEVGSNIGSHTVFIGRDLCPAGKVFAFEPRRVLFQMLCTNLILNNVTNVHTYQMGIGESEQWLEEAPLDLEAERNFGDSSLGDEIGTGEMIHIQPLDAMMDQLPKISVLKADVEGNERDVILGARKLIDRDRPVLYVENDRSKISRPLLELIDSLQFDMYWSYSKLFREDNFAGNQQNIFGNIVSCNLLCIPKARNISVAGQDPIADFDFHPFPR